ncbi:uncharacterized protein GGS22DRAFT_160566 [Annulohypoxylon maeteangense]|uniref:uncharacterized protein n=1 Tax=Annulohypoxylon maeteangense TaxID=1927788 RepID=UPI00200829F6|nr:uncharacterized protein GGS22DRAFT_160566 [Annulohypoxylon maeteangense]KAI0886320.1 hypothetical protein GGS22DRAFT_160566 [Annulohypoxylon maeteangense]
MMTYKRKRSENDVASRSTVTKRSRHTESPDLLSPLPNELLIRILAFLPLPDLLNIAPLSRRFYDLFGDSQIWKRLYYSRFVLPRALRIPGFRNGSAREGKLHYSSRKAVWADGRRGGWVDMHVGKLEDRSRDWKKQYKLRHNWSKGKCAVEELQLRQELPPPETTSPHKMLVKISEGIAITADIATGLRAWDLKTKHLLAQIGLGQVNSQVVPSCITIDDQGIHDKILGIAIGFSDGSFGTWTLNIQDRGILRRYRHEKSTNGELVGIAFSYPYLLTATKSVLISLYTFNGPPKSARPGAQDLESKTTGDSESETMQETDESPSTRSTSKIRNSEPVALRAPYLLTSLKSHTSRAPLALSIRKTAVSIVASIAYTFSTLQGWCLGIQDLHLRPSTSGSKSTPDITTTRLAYSLPVRSSPTHIPSPPTSPSQPSNLLSSQDDQELDGPINLCYTHPYLLATLSDNTLILYLCTSNATSLSISPGIRLWGHTSGISDAEITARGKAVSVSCRGEEIRVWELEGKVHGKSIEVRPTVKPTVDDTQGVGNAPSDDITTEWDDRRNWVGFDDEMVIVLKESKGRESLMVYDFT